MNIEVQYQMGLKLSCIHYYSYFLIDTFTVNEVMGMVYVYIALPLLCFILIY